MEICSRISIGKGSRMFEDEATPANFSLLLTSIAGAGTVDASFGLFTLFQIKFTITGKQGGK